MNQRRRTRVESRKAVTVVGKSLEPCRGEIVNLSLKGCLMGRLDGVPPPAGEAITICIHLEPGDPGLDVPLCGRVVRHLDAGVAIDFTSVSPESFPHLFRLVQYNAPDPEQIESELASSAFDPAKGPEG